MNNELFEAITELHFLRFKEILDEGVDVNAANDQGVSPLIHAFEELNFLTEEAIAIRIKMIEELIKRGAYLDEVDEHGHTPLTYSIMLDSSELVSILIANGANAEIGFNNGTSTPIFWAISKKKLRALEALLKLKVPLDMRAAFAKELAKNDPAIQKLFKRYKY